MNRIFSFLALLGGLASTAGALDAQVVYQARCPSDSVDAVTENGITFHGISARRYVEGFLSGDPAALARTSTGTSALDSSMVALLYDAVERDRYACMQLNDFISNGTSGYPSRPWVYFRAGNFYFVARWTTARTPSGGLQTGYGTVMVFDANLEPAGSLERVGQVHGAHEAPP
jgi:hypothetical protein